jgi:hypothetical protein
MNDESPHVRVAAAHALAHWGSEAQRADALAVLLDHADLSHNRIYTVVAALNALDALGDRAATVRDKVRALPDTAPDVIDKMKDYVPRLKESILTR